MYIAIISGYPQVAAASWGGFFDGANSIAAKLIAVLNALLDLLKVTPELIGKLGETIVNLTGGVGWALIGVIGVIATVIAGRHFRTWYSTVHKESRTTAVSAAGVAVFVNIGENRKRLQKKVEDAIEAGDYVKANHFQALLSNTNKMLLTTGEALGALEGMGARERMHANEQNVARIQAVAHVAGQALGQATGGPAALVANGVQRALGAGAAAPPPPQVQDQAQNILRPGPAEALQPLRLAPVNEVNNATNTALARARSAAAAGNSSAARRSVGQAAILVAQANSRAPAGSPMRNARLEKTANAVALNTAASASPRRRSPSNNGGAGGNASPINRLPVGIRPTIREIARNSTNLAEARRMATAIGLPLNGNGSVLAALQNLMRKKA
jgi:hypothetical protein